MFLTPEKFPLWQVDVFFGTKFLSPISCTFYSAVITFSLKCESIPPVRRDISSFYVQKPLLTAAKTRLPRNTP